MKCVQNDLLVKTPFAVTSGLIHVKNHFIVNTAFNSLHGETHYKPIHARTLERSLISVAYAGSNLLVLTSLHVTKEHTVRYLLHTVLLSRQ